jgi:YfiH family protein
MKQQKLRPDSEIYTSVPSFTDERAHHAFFGRRGGVSGGLYDSLNCGVGSQDERANVLENRSRVASAMGVAPERLLSLHQTHSTICLTVREPWGLMDRPQADAQITDVPGLALGVLASDCAPVLFYASSNKPIIGVAHAGWGGALKGVLENTVFAMQKLGAGDIKACIGPCIAKASYEVTEEFSKPFLELYDEDERFFHAGKRPGHLMFDLAGYCAARLARAGVKNVHIVDADTYALEGDFYSYRRATHRKEKDYGRQISAIVLKNT